MTVRIGVDTGGTFTDVVLYDEASGAVHTAKTPSTPPDFDRGVLVALDEGLDRAGLGPAEVTFLSHGTTVGTNAVLEGDLPPLGLVTNEGLRDVLEIGDQTRPALYDLQADKPPHLIPRRHRKGVAGRIDFAGEEVEPLDEAAAREAVRELADAGVEAIVVSMLFSYLNDAHERRVGELVEAEAPDLPYALSSTVDPEPREYGRTVTTVLNEAVKSRTAAYFERLRDGIADRSQRICEHSEQVMENMSKANELAVRHEEIVAHTNSLLHNLPGMAYRAKNEDGWPCVFATEGAEELLGYSTEEFVSGSIDIAEDVLHPDDVGPVMEATAEAIEAGDDYDIMYRMVTADGEEIQVREWGRGIFDESGTLVAIEGYIWDPDTTGTREVEPSADTTAEKLEKL
jgi:PAS domain-containing protein